MNRIVFTKDIKSYADRCDTPWARSKCYGTSSTFALSIQNEWVHGGTRCVTVRALAPVNTSGREYQKTNIVARASCQPEGEWERKIRKIRRSRITSPSRTRIVTLRTFRCASKKKPANPANNRSYKTVWTDHRVARSQGAWIE